MQLRDPYSPPSHPDGAQTLPPRPEQARDTIFRHPAYDDRCNVILMLPALDHPDGALDYNTALVACAIVANNAWSGYFTLDRAGEDRVAPPDGLLREKSYYFRPSDSANERYPILLGFQHWLFPTRLPAPWSDQALISALPLDRPMPRQSSLQEALLARDVSCRLTNALEGTEHAHLVPRSEAAWFNANAMFCHARPNRPGIAAIDVPQNALLLRSDIHTVFDQKRIVFTPKSSTFVAHVLAPGSSSELTRLYHNVALQPITGVVVEFLFARFAWAVFAYLKFFLSAPTARTVCIVENGQAVVRDLDPGQLSAMMMASSTTRSKSRSTSPQKRKREADLQEDAEQHERGRRRRRSVVVASFSASASSSASSSSSSFGGAAWRTDDAAGAADCCDTDASSDVDYDFPTDCVAKPVGSVEEAPVEE